MRAGVEAVEGEEVGGGIPLRPKLVLYLVSRPPLPSPRTASSSSSPAEEELSCELGGPDSDVMFWREIGSRDAGRGGGARGRETRETREKVGTAERERGEKEAKDGGAQAENCRLVSVKNSWARGGAWGGRRGGRGGKGSGDTEGEDERWWVRLCLEGGGGSRTGGGARARATATARDTETGRGGRGEKPRGGEDEGGGRKKESVGRGGMWVVEPVSAREAAAAAAAAAQARGQARAGVQQAWEGGGGGGEGGGGEGGGVGSNTHTHAHTHSHTQPPTRPPTHRRTHTEAERRNVMVAVAREWFGEQGFMYYVFLSSEGALTQFSTPQTSRAEGGGGGEGAGGGIAGGSVGVRDVCAGRGLERLLAGR